MLHSTDQIRCINMNGECEEHTQDANLKLGAAVNKTGSDEQTGYHATPTCILSWLRELWARSAAVDRYGAPCSAASAAAEQRHSTRAGNESCNAAVLQAKPWHHGRPLVAQPLQQSRQAVERCLNVCQASSNVSFAVETPGSPGAYPSRPPR